MSRTLFASLFIAIVCYLINPVAAQNTSLPNRIVQQCKASLGKSMWGGYGLSKGTLGCAAALSNVLNKAGVKQAKSAAVVIVRRQLLGTRDGAEKIVLKRGGEYGLDQSVFRKTVKPGDVFLAFSDDPSKPNLGPHAHCGIVSDSLQIYTNDWNDGIWKEAPMEQYFSYYKYYEIIRLRS